MKNTQRFFLTFSWCSLGNAELLGNGENLQILQSRILFILVATLLNKFSVELGFFDLTLDLGILLPVIFQLFV